MRPKAFPLLRFEGMLTEPDTMSVVSKAEDGCIRSDWPPRLLVAVGCPGGVGSRGFQKKRDVYRYYAWWFDSGAVLFLLSVVHLSILSPQRVNTQL